MKDIWQELLEWTEAGTPFAVARVVQTWKSAPRSAGAGMIIGPNMEVAGSVSGGCIEAAVIEEALDVLDSGKPRKLTYGVEDELALSVGLSCGGEVTVMVEKHWAFSENMETRQVWTSLRDALRKNEPAALLTRLNAGGEPPLLVMPGTKTLGDWGSLQHPAVMLAEDTCRDRQSRVVEIDGEEVFIQVFPRQDQLLIVGAAHICIPLVMFAKILDFQSVVIDPRKVFANPDRFPVKPDHLIPKWPQDVLADWPLHEDTYALLLTHDPKIDDPALKILLSKDIPYIGALGSRKTHGKRCVRLREAGFSECKIDRIKGPAGLDIRAKTAAEIALSMIAEVTEAKRKRDHRAP